MRVALVDDNKNDLALLHEYISEQTAHSCQIDTFSSGESIVSRNSFAEIESIFCSHSYFYTSTKGVIVNFYEIAQQKSDLFIMSDGTHIPISRRKSRETLDAFAQFRFSDLRKGGEQ